MNRWVLIIAAIVGLILLYVLFFYLARLVGAGSPFRIWLSYLGPRIRSRLGLDVPSGKTRSNQRSRHPKDLEFPTSEPAQPAPSTATTKPKPAKQPVQQARKEAKPSGRLAAMAVPSFEPFSRQAAMQAAAARRRVWIKYLDEGKASVVDKLEIYKTTIDGNLLAWFCSKRKCESFLRRRIVAWQLLDETFERSDQVERWARREAMLGLPKRLYRLLKKDD